MTDWNSDGDEDYEDGLISGVFLALDGWPFIVFVIGLTVWLIGKSQGWW